MATNFPTSVDVLTNPTTSDSLNSPSHSTQHANANDAIEAIETYVLAQQPTFRNVFTNGEFTIDQRNSGASQTFTAAAALAYSVDRWYGFCTGANVTGQQVAGTAPNQFHYRFTGLASNTVVGFGQRIEATNAFHLAAKTATLSVSLASSSLTSVTWSAFYANTTNTFGTLASPTRTSIATGTFTITSTLTNYSVNIAIPSAATTGLEIVFTTGALLGSQTLTFAQAQLELGSVATPFERIPIDTEISLCKRYYQRYSGGVGCGMTGIASTTTGLIMNFSLNTDMRIAPSASGSGQVIISDQFALDHTITSIGVSAPQGANTTGGRFSLSGPTGLTVGRYYSSPGASIGTGFIDFSAEL